MRELK
jgi:hypothetical protein